MRPSDDDLLPELPPLLDDGESVGEEAYDFDLDDPDDGPWDDGVAIVEDETPLAIANDDDASWLDDRTADMDLGETEGLGGEPEYGFLDDAPLESLDLGLDGSEEGPTADDGGEEGTDDPLVPAVGSDDDATDLPVIEESDEDGEGPDEDAIGGELDDDGEEPVPRTHRGA